MPKRQELHLHGPVEFADGRIMDYEKWTGLDYIDIYRENNSEIFEEAAMQDSSYAAIIRAGKRHEATKLRKEKLRKEWERIDKELNGA